MLSPFARGASSRTSNNLNLRPLATTRLLTTRPAGCGGDPDGGGREGSECWVEWVRGRNKACDTPDGGMRVETRAGGAMAEDGEGELPKASLDGDDTEPELKEGSCKDSRWGGGRCGRKSGSPKDAAGGFVLSPVVPLTTSAHICYSGLALLTGRARTDARSRRVNRSTSSTSVVDPGGRCLSIPSHPLPHSPDSEGTPPKNTHL